jgi:hypothetical protein
MFRLHLRDLIRPPGADSPEAPDQAQNGVIPLDDPRLLRTLEVLHTRGAGLADVGVQVLADADGWSRWYLGALGADADRCLSPSVFRDWAMHHVPDPDETAEDR